jgi:hypothetical protein
MNDPDYSYPRGLFPSVTRNAVLLRQRNFHKDAKDGKHCKLLLMDLRGEFA